MQERFPVNDWLESHRTLILGAVGLTVACSLLALALRLRQPAAVVVEAAPTASGATATPSPTATPGQVRVYVSGAVAAPDVYQLPAGSIVRDALAAAGGPTENADLTNINLAHVLQDGQQVYVPTKGELPPPAPLSEPASESAGTPSGPININTATQAELETLPGIGPTLAAEIVAYREASGPFAQIEDIQNVPGIGPGRFEQISGLITVE
jgi:competence protein ComEA